jgi:hypothetical protein
MAKGNHINSIERRPICLDTVIVGKGIFVERLKETSRWVATVIPGEIVSTWVSTAKKFELGQWMKKRR